MNIQILVSIGLFGLLGCAGRSPVPGAAMTQASSLDLCAERYVKLVLAVGRHDPNYVDYYYGPPAWADDAKTHITPLGELESRAAALAKQIDAIAVLRDDEMLSARRRSLLVQARSVSARVKLLLGTKMRFDEESEALYDARAAIHEDVEFEPIHRELGGLVPGDGPLHERIEKLRSEFVVPREKLPAVLHAVIEEAKRRTLNHIALPRDEILSLEFVNGKSWGAYNFYQGHAKSVIQVNTDLPMFVSRTIVVGAHEAYPGHHVYNALLERHLVLERGWVEYTVGPLFSPQSFLAEGSANYGAELAFPDRREYLRKVVLPLAGISGDHFDAYMDVEERVEKLAYAENEAARRYLDGHVNREQARSWLAKFRVMSPERADKFMSNVEAVRSYVITYNLGRDRIAQYIDRNGGTAGATKRWELFRGLLSRPVIPSELR
jgi:hypothetical protein